METTGDVGGPSEAILKFVFPFVKWREGITRGELVCKQWRTAARSDDVWRSYCDEEIKLCRETLHNLRTKPWHSEEVKEKYRNKEHVSIKHKMLATQAEGTSASGRSLRDVFILARGMDASIMKHKMDGPSSIRKHSNGNDDTRSLRDATRHDFKWIVAPSIEHLRQIFQASGGDIGKEKRAEEIDAMKERLLLFAQGHTVLRRQLPSRMEKRDLLRLTGQNFLAAATMASKGLGDNVFVPTSPHKATVGEIVTGIEGIMGCGKKIDVPPGVQQFRLSPDGKIERGISY